MKLPLRAAGVLLHPTSLPGAGGIGTIGAAARAFADWLAAAGQRLWQVLPLGPTGYGNSPYMGLSAFAGNPLLVDEADLVARGLLRDRDLERGPELSSGRVDFPAVLRRKGALMEEVSRRFVVRASARDREAYAAFCAEHAAWLDDYALFRALKTHYGERMWTEWPTDVAAREPGPLAAARERLATHIERVKLGQQLFFAQWAALKEHCNGLGVRLIGDLPIYVAHDSAEVWAHPELFRLDEQLGPEVVAGVPPDFFSATGQRWGNPIYRWERMRERGFAWWIERFRRNLELTDALRLDHFRGFEAFWEIPGTDETAENGQWVTGPGRALFDAVRDALGPVEILAEDLGVITPEVEALLRHTGYPGIKVLQMAFGTEGKADEYKPFGHPRNAAVYTSTHDHDTTLGWFTATPGEHNTQAAEETERERARVRLYTGTSGQALHWDFIRLALSSVAKWAIVPLQDALGLSSEARMNRPGTGSGNWEWRMRAGATTPELAQRLRELAEIFGRTKD